MFQKKSNKMVYIVLILLFLVVGGYFAWYYGYLDFITPKSNQNDVFNLNLSRQLKLSVRMVDRINKSYIYGGEYCIYDSSFNKIECQSTFGEKFTTSYLIIPEKGVMYFIIAKKKGDYLAYLNTIIIPSNIFEHNIELIPYPTCQPLLQQLNQIEGEKGILILNLSCKKGYFQKPLICTDWSNGFIYAVGEKQIARCDIYNSIGANINFSGYWQNISSFDYNEDLRKYVNITYLPKENYFCGNLQDENVIINKCQEIHKKDCILQEALTPARHRKYANNCFSLPFSPAGWEPTQKSYLFNISYKTFNPNEKDKITFYLMDSECLKIGFVENNPFIKCTIDVEDEFGKDVGGLDMNYTFYYNYTIK